MAGEGAAAAERDGGGARGRFQAWEGGGREGKVWDGEECVLVLRAPFPGGHNGQESVPTPIA